MTAAELETLEFLDSRLNETSVRTAIDRLAAETERELAKSPTALMAWRSIPLPIYGGPLPAGIQSSWVFILRAGVTTGAERHPNSHQRVMSYRGRGDLQTLVQNEWMSHELESDCRAPLIRRWASIPEMVWHQAVVPASEHWTVVSFHTATDHELIEERPEGDGTRQRLYLPT